MKRSNFINRSPYLYIVIGFAAVILLGSGILMLPISLQQPIAYIDALFVSTSAVCITGLSSVTLQTVFTPFGKIVIALLIQIGGLGFTTVAMAVFALLGVKLGISEKFLVQETLGSAQHIDFRKFLFRAIAISFIAEGIGFCINLIALCGDYSGIQLVGYSAFQSISAFNNAGFDLFGATSLIAFDDNALLLLNTAFLTIVGGLGFLVINDIFTIRRRRRLAEHTKLMLCITAGLLTLGTVGFLLSELGKIDFLNAFFMSAMTRTCGFTSVDLSQWSNASILLADFLMFIGAGPASTGGGIKCTTFFIVCAAAIAFVRGKPVVIFHRSIGKDLVARCMLITLFAAACVFVAGTSICALDPEYSTAHVFFETISAFANVGLSAGITADLSVGSKVILCLSMYIGRIGFITALMVLRKRWNRGDDETIRCAPAEILVG